MRRRTLTTTGGNGIRFRRRHATTASGQRHHGTMIHAGAVQQMTTGADGRQRMMEHEESQESVYITFADFRGTVKTTLRELVDILMPYIKEALEEDEDET